MEPEPLAEEVWRWCARCLLRRRLPCPCPLASNVAPLISSSFSEESSEEEPEETVAAAPEGKPRRTPPPSTPTLPFECSVTEQAEAGRVMMLRSEETEVATETTETLELLRLWALGRLYENNEEAAEEEPIEEVRLAGRSIKEAREGGDALRQGDSGMA
jgi:hypothetical protein